MVGSRSLQLAMGSPTGLAVLGVGGRGVMRIPALVAGRPPHASLGATMGIVLIAVYGIVLQGVLRRTKARAVSAMT